MFLLIQDYAVDIHDVDENSNNTTNHHERVRLSICSESPRQVWSSLVYTSRTSVLTLYT